jgi:hypothetical protein
MTFNGVEITKEMVNYFTDRTLEHTTRVSKYLNRAILMLDLFPENKIYINFLKTEASQHDASKYKYPEYLPYILLTWKYKKHNIDKDTSFDYDSLTKTLINQAYEHHILNNKHHPEHWASFITIKDNNGNKDQVLDCSRMPKEYLYVMAADLCAMSEENGNNPIDWFKENNGKRWSLNMEQSETIIETLYIMWRKDV